MSEKSHKVVSATEDAVFKEIFTSPDCHNYTCKIISEITGIKFKTLKKHLKVINSTLPLKNVKERSKNADVLLTVKDNIINLEMNGSYYKGLFEKNDIYHHTIISRVAKKSEKYSDYKRVIQISFDNFNHFKKTVSKFAIMELDTYEIENDAYIKYHINLSKIFDMYYNKKKLSYLEKLALVMKLSTKEELEKISKGDEILMEYKDKVEDLSLEELFADLLSEEYAEEQKKIEMELKRKYYQELGYEDGKKEGYEDGKKQGLEDGKREGLQQGLEQGLEQGKKAAKIETAKNMLTKDIDINIISEVTGLSKKEIENLK